MGKIEDAIKMLQEAQETIEVPAPATEKKEEETPVVTETVESTTVVAETPAEPVKEEPAVVVPSTEAPVETEEATNTKPKPEPVDPDSVLKNISEDSSLEEDIEELEKFLKSTKQEDKSKFNQQEILHKVEDLLKEKIELESEVYSLKSKIKFLEDLNVKESGRAFEAIDKVSQLEYELKKNQNMKLPEPVVPLGTAWTMYDEAKGTTSEQKFQLRFIGQLFNAIEKETGIPNIAKEFLGETLIKMGLANEIPDQKSASVPDAPKPVQSTSFIGL